MPLHHSRIACLDVPARAIFRSSAVFKCEAQRQTLRPADIHGVAGLIFSQ